MPSYHPPKMITNNSAPVITADLAYEGHGKCGCQTVVLSDNAPDGTTPITVWEASAPAGQPTIPGCTDYSHAYKIVALENTKFRNIQANNIGEDSLAALVFANGGFKLLAGHEIMADFTTIDILSGTLMVYRDCEQS